MYGLSLASIPFLGPRTLDRQIAAMFRRAEGVWYDPSDFERYMAVGPELVVNGGFAENVNNWSGLVTWVDGEACITSTGGSYPSASTSPDFQTDVGKTYILKATARRGTGAWNVKVRARSFANAELAASSAITTTAPTNVEIAFVATTTLSRVQVYADNGTTVSGETAYFDNISVRELTAISTATMFQDAAGLTPVTAVEQPVGLILDKSKGLVLGAELVGPIDMQAGWSASSATVVDANTFTTSVVGGVWKDVFTPGKTYKLTVAGVTTGGLEFRTWDGATQAIQLVGFGTAVFTVPTGQTRLYLRQATAGATDIVSISVRELPGNHASQTVSTRRPVLKQSAGVYFLQFDGVDDALVTPSIDFGAVHSSAPLGAELVVNGDFSAGADGWTSLLGGTISVTGGVATVSSSASLANTVGTQINTVPGRVYLVLVDVTSLSAGSQSVLVGTAIAGSDLHANYSTAVGRRSAFFTATTTTTYVSWGCGASSRSAVIDNISVKEIPVAYMPDKMTVVAGVRGVSASGTQQLLETSVNYAANTGAFQASLNEVNAGSFAFARKSSVSTQFKYQAVQVQPKSSVFSALSDFSVASPASAIALRENGLTIAATAGGTNATGNYGNYPLYIGSRAGTSLPFNGNLHQLAIFGATLTAAELAIVERYVGRKTGITL